MKDVVQISMEKNVSLARQYISTAAIYELRLSVNLVSVVEMDTHEYLTRDS